MIIELTILSRPILRFLYFVFCTMPFGVLGRIDLHSEKPIGLDFPRLCVALFARCQASRLKKRLDPEKIDLKSIFHAECQYALA